ncbi:UDP-3-O-(3-hydroxymyristoyl)glucosamine N-acyltransferase [Shewanella sp. 202IG2-18]|uniref:UDP-3-O-(3-hydroxymyristoyl)glucosamine N-acyltransferase n=1 Tax=Parashewanella hymeniacidonis TaxID=2807618 RepID=UPI00195F9D88|nr:UDP-3-O-(3-hydroxymyristoyl)glucosamine N-acyltransferase [Parashewanella hymeniacidonis]MBM7071769.1 UDP-3-O-(3-hydroxymyristoyl)glucosamine N-acyltransferase [Parashewanella hymeniacidonis]
MQSITLNELANRLNGEVKGNGDALIYSVATLESAKTGQLSFLSNSKYRSQLEMTQATAVLLSDKLADEFEGNAVLVKDPYVAFARVAQLLDTTPKAADVIHPSAQIDSSAKLGENVTVGANAVIGQDVILGDNVQVGAGSVIGQESVVGSNTRIWANVTVYHRVQIGTDCIIHSGAVIGSDGFGYANEAGNWIKIPQTGGVQICDRVEIGAGTTIDRGALEDTVIEDGVILDNQVQVAHNVVIGANSAVAGNSTFAGSCTIGKYCIIGGNSAIAGHLSVADGTHISGATNVTHDIKKAEVLSSATIAMPNKLWRRNTVRFRQLDELFQRVKTLEKTVESQD